MSSYEILFYKKNARIGFTTFSDFEAAAEYLGACIVRYMRKGNYIVNTDSIYSITVLDLTPDEMMIQMLCQFDNKMKNFVMNVLTRINNTITDDCGDYMKFN